MLLIIAAVAISLDPSIVFSGLLLLFEGHNVAEPVLLLVLL